MNTRKWWTAALAAVAVVASGCGGGTAPAPGDDQPRSLFDLVPPAAEDQIALTAFAGTRACADLEQRIEDTAVLEMRTALESSYRWAVQYWQSTRARQKEVLGGMMDAGSMSGSGGAGGSGGTSAGAPGPTDFTTTNNQVQGVDEADFVKNDGTRIFVLSGRSLYTALSWPATALSRQGKLDLEGYPHQLLKHGEDTLVVFSKVSLADLPSPGSYSCSSLSCLQWSSNAVKVTVVDVSDLSRPAVVREAYFPGRYETARLIGDSVRLVVTSRLGLPYGATQTWLHDITRYDTLEALRAAFLRLGLTNEATIRARALSEWIPEDRVVAADGSRLFAPLDCASVAAPNGSTELGLTSVVTMDLARPGTFQRTALLARAGHVYASAGSLYVASPHWWWGWGWWGGAPADDVTYLHRFDLSDPAASRWIASGKVRGHLVDQFAMDEHRGFLRVAATRREYDKAPQGSWWSAQTVSEVTVLGTSGQTLLPVGSSGDLAPGERIMGVRFLGDQGYVVTFRQVDPLFTFDLSDPYRPTKLGELKVEGFSTYLHPIDATHLLGIGTYVPEGGGWGTRALQLAIFDVSDLKAPRQTFRQIIGTWSTSEAQWEHKAFNYFASHKRLAVPYASWEYDSSTGSYWTRFVSDLRVYDVDVNTGFTPRGALGFGDLYSRSAWGWSYYWGPQVRRSIMADDFVYAIGDAGLRVAHVGDLSTPLATVQFDAVSN